ncbi:MAG: hypothetical protein P8123_09755 [bacterium]
MTANDLRSMFQDMMRSNPEVEAVVRRTLNKVNTEKTMPRAKGGGGAGEWYDPRILDTELTPTEMRDWGVPESPISPKPEPNPYYDPRFNPENLPEEGFGQGRTTRRGKEPKKPQDYPEVPSVDPIQSGVDALVRGGMARDKAVITSALQDLAIDMGYAGDDIAKFASNLKNQARMKNLLVMELQSQGIARQLAEEGSDD